MNTATCRAGIIGLGFIEAAGQTSGDALGQQVENLDGTHLFAEALQVLESIWPSTPPTTARAPGRNCRFRERTVTDC